MKSELDRALTMAEHLQEECAKLTTQNAELKRERGRANDLLERCQERAAKVEARAVELKEQVATLTAQLTMADDPAMDATDAAHPAWWRGCDYGCLSITRKVEEVLLGKDDGSGTAANAEWESLRRQLLEKMARAQRVIDDNHSLTAELAAATKRAETAEAER